MTSHAEENITSWRIKKTEKYLELLEEARANGSKAHCRTIEVGARRFVSKPSMNVFSLFGFNDKEREDQEETIEDSNKMQSFYLD